MTLSTVMVSYPLSIADPNIEPGVLTSRLQSLGYIVHTLNNYYTAATTAEMTRASKDSMRRTPR